MAVEGKVKEALLIHKHHNFNQDDGLAVSPVWTSLLWTLIFHSIYRHLPRCNDYVITLYLGSYACIVLPEENCQSAIETLQTKFFAFYCLRPRSSNIKYI